jgi:hypothetical protein
MAVIGHAEIVVRAITNNFEKELKGTLSNISKSISIGAGRKIGDGFADGFNRSQAKTTFGQLADGLKSLVPEAESARERFQSLMRTGYVLQGALGSLVGAISSVVVSIGPLIGSLLKAAPAAAGLANAFVTLKVGMLIAKTAFGGIFDSVKKATQQNGGYTKSLKEIREEWQQLLFDAEAASYSEEEAALNLERAFENLRRTADLPPNSAARREAELEYKKADLAFRRAKDKTKDLNEVVKDGYDAFKDAQKDKSGGADAFDGLNSAQKEFAKRLLQLTPKLDALKLKMSEAFLKPLYNSVDIFEKKLFPILDKRLPEVAGKIGTNIDKVFQRIATPDNVAKIDRILLEMQPTLDLIGDLVGNVADIFLSIMDATDELAQGGLKWIVDLTKTWSDTLTQMNADGSLTKFFNDAGAEAAKWGKVIGNVFGGFGNLIKLTTGPGSAGEEMLKWFTEASEGFKTMFSEDPDSGKKFFKDAMVNARAVLSSIGELVKQVLGVADNPNIAKTFDKLAEGAPYIGKMLDAFIDAGPSFAELVVNVVRIFAALTDSKQLSAFFDTLSVGADKLADFLEAEGVQGFLDKVGPIIGFFSALGVIIDAVAFGFNVFIGYIAFAFAKMNGLLGPVTKLFGDKPGGGVFGNLGKTLKAGGIVGVIIFIISKIIEFYNKFEDFRIMVDTVLAGVGEAFSGLWESIGGLFDNLFGNEGLGGLMAAFDPILKFLLEGIIPAVGGAIEGIINSLSSIIDFISNTVGVLFDSVGTVIEGIMDLFKGNFGSGLAKIFGGIGIALLGIIQFIVNGVITLINVGILDRINSFISSIAEGPLGKFVKDTFGLDLGKAKISKLTLVDWTGDAKKNLDKYLAGQNAKSGTGTKTKADGTPKLALGGTVYPSNGGTMVTVAEAGRPERIEPLNPNGLSDRDIALINQMGGGQGINITVNPAPGMDEKELAAAVSRQLAFEMRKGTI